MFEPLGLGADTQVALGVALLGAVVVLTFVAWFALRRDERIARDRARRLTIVGAEGASSVPSPRAPSAKDIPALQRLGALLAGITPSAMVARTTERLQQAGRPMDLDAADFIALRALSTIVLALAAGVAMWALRVDPTAVVLIALAGALLGYAVPGILLGRAIRRRQRAIVRAMPTALDMLALSTAAGLTLDGAMNQVMQRWDTPLSVELRRYLAEVQIGRDRRVALRALAHRVDVQEVSRLSTAIVQADALGLPIARVLQEQATEMRRIARQRAEEAARSAPVKMVFPLVLLIFPALFVVVLGPAVPRIMELFQSY